MECVAVLLLTYEMKQSRKCVLAISSMPSKKASLKVSLSDGKFCCVLVAADETPGGGGGGGMTGVEEEEEVSTASVTLSSRIFSVLSVASVSSRGNGTEREGGSEGE